jgi:hypothetical protein
MTASRSSTDPPDFGEAAAAPDKDGMPARARASATAGDLDQAIALYRTILADPAPMRALEHWIEQVVRQPPTSAARSS